MSDVVLYDVTDGVGTITLNRPESMNAMNGEMLNTMYKVAGKAAEDPGVRAVLLTGNGRAFSAGGDVKGMADRPFSEQDPDAPKPPKPTLRDQEEFSRLLQEMAKPTVAAVNGVAAGAGFSVALACDLRIVSEQARFTTAFAKVGFSGDFGGTWLLQRLIGPMKAKELYFMSEIIDAKTALAMGIVTKVVPHESLMDEAMAVARRLAAGPTVALGRMKDNFTYGATSTFADLLTREAENMVEVGKTEDHKAAVRAFVEKRDPEFHGR